MKLCHFNHQLDPGFREGHGPERLSRDDAANVIVIHTSCGGFGKLTSKCIFHTIK